MSLLDLFRKTRVNADDVEVIGAPTRLRGDVYHELLRASWWSDLGVFAFVWLGLNAIFAVLYFAVGGVAGVRPGRPLDYLYFSVQTMGTIGYGAMYPTSDAAQLLVTLQSFVGIVVVALATGLVFTKWMRFAREIVVAPYEGVPTLQLRLGNERSSQILEAVVRVVAFRTERTREGTTMYRMHDVQLDRERAPTLSRSWTVMHRITPASPLWPPAPETLAAGEIELLVTVVGVDDTSAQPLHARHRYVAERVRFGARYVDMLTELADGRLRLDMGKFDEVAPTTPTADFPYPPPSDG